jgi:class 3 adenylate cyclase
MLQTRQLAAIMFTDIVGYTALMGEDEQKAFELLRKNRQLQKPLIEQNNGRWIKELGDGVLASFNTVSDAVNTAIKIQKACNISKDFLLRIGIHHGEVVFEENDVFGDAVNIASRRQALAPIGGIWVSESVHNNVSNKTEINTKFVRAEMLKNVKEPVRIYEIVTDASTAPLKRPNETGEVLHGKKPFIPISKNRKRNKLIIITCLIVLFLAVTIAGY